MSAKDRKDLQLSAIDVQHEAGNASAARGGGTDGERQIQELARQLIEKNVGSAQRRFFLEEQLKLIQNELGLLDEDHTTELDLFRQRLRERHLPKELRQSLEGELRRFSRLDPSSADYTAVHSYLDWLTALPWGLRSTDMLDPARARAVLDQAHCGLDDVKQRILEFLAVGAYKGALPGAILLLVGPPGVGKSSLGKAVAQALGRKFYRFSVGGIREESDIKGQRRALPGAMPGRFIQAIRDCGVDNPVIMLDEVDKIGACYQGDPVAALLEVLDPDQNQSFYDAYLETEFDLSKVLFICTANQLYTVPGPLLDRMEIIRFVGYIMEEKLAIAKRHLWPKQLAKAGVRSSRLRLSDAALRQIINGYAREAGVLGLDKRLGRIVRKAVSRMLEGQKTPIRITPQDLEDYLGQPVFLAEKPMSGVGVVTGLAWTASGGVTLPVEASVINHKKTGFKLTGKLGDVMRESAEIAYSYVAAHLAELRGKSDFFDHSFVHVHMPEGAIPKDGPSAGVAMATALLSLARAESVKPVLAMTGELTLTGHVLRVGGIREKVIAARRNRIRQLVLPADNRSDYLELPEYVRAGMQIHFVKHYSEVVEVVFARKPVRKERANAS